MQNRLMKTYPHSPVHCSINYNGQYMETTEVTISERMYEEDGIYTDRERLVKSTHFQL